MHRPLQSIRERTVIVKTDCAYSVHGAHFVIKRLCALKTCIHFGTCIADKLKSDPTPT